MTTLLNDKGQTVTATGAPGSIERARCEHPGLIAKLTQKRNDGKLTRLAAAQLMGNAKIPLIAERMVILQAVGLTEVEARNLVAW